MTEGKSARVPVLYLAPWVDYGGSDKNTIDWFRWIDRDRFAPSLITTQPSPNRLLTEIAPFAEEVWALPDLMPAEDMPAFIFDFMHSRKVRVLHLMNSRLGFELLPDLACLPQPPGVVVQLHVEEADRSGYVRYVTTRYGNLVDRFSTSNRHVADAVEGYGIPAEKVRVIYTGADPDEEFSPDLTEPIEDLPDDRLQILFAARLVAQKDPLLMLEVASALRDRGVSFQIHVVGEGDLEDELRERIAADELGEHVLLHPPTPGLQRWYSACDVLLMTSTFEGIPCVVFEAMAMGMPIVAPDLPAIGELLGETDDALVSPRSSVEGYAAALAHLAEDRARMEALGAQMRARARAQFTVQQMAADHGELYDELVESAPPEPAAGANRAVAEPIRFTSRPQTGTPLVSVLVPHFNQAQFLGECIESVRAQTYPKIEVVVVDDASTEHDADAVLSELERDGDVTVLRLTENRGPSHARNAGLERCEGRYIHPVDADNVLLPDAVERLVEQLNAADETVGFIYPNIQYFGNREDYYEVPEYNVYTLLHGNFCDTCSLLDREIFDAGERYREEIHLGHEDWEFVLRLASRGVRGEAARGPTVRYRKWGFNRSDLVDHAADRFDEVLAEISPFKGREAEIKAIESPVLSIVPLREPDGETEGSRTLTTKLSAQTCTDVELVAPQDELPEAISRARGSYLALTSGTGSSLLDNPAFCEKVLRRFGATDNEIDAIALIDAGEDGRFPFRALAADEGPHDAAPHTVIWRRTVELELPRGLLADPGTPVGSIVRLLSGAGLRVEWRHAVGEGEGGEAEGAWVALPGNPASAEDPHNLRPGARPLLPGDGEYRVPRWEDTPTWMPPLSTLAIRYRENHGGRRLITSGPAPVGFTAEHHLGALRCTSFEGTTRLVRVGDEYEAIPRGEWNSAPEGAEEIGYAELAGFPQMDALAFAVHRETGQRFLVTLTGDDPVLNQVDLAESIGYIEPFPARPRQTPTASLRTHGLVGLTRAADHQGRRHRYALGEVPEGELLSELGGLAESGRQGSIGAWIVDGYLLTERHRPPTGRASSFAAARWAAEPAAWRGLASPAARTKVSARRAAMAAARIARAPRPLADPVGEPEGWLFSSERPGRAPLFAAYHPVTGDQLLTRSPQDAAQLGYGAAEMLGYMRCIAPVTGDLHLRPLPIPWARRFGAVPLSG
ncbi:MAG TPA: glycosyltransferase [Solirubrobacterales bacterium]|nr:glycosyltransferase [Solirubrobacterales bacterium]